MKQTNDDAIEQIRKVRRRISEAQENNAENLVNYYIELQKNFHQHREKSVSEKKQEEEKLPLAA